MLVLLDNNFVDRDGLREYMKADPSNRAAIPHAAFMEWHKGAAEKVTRRVLQQACSYGSRILILRDTQSLIRMRGQRKRIMSRLIDEQQTRDFPSYCADYITSPVTPETTARFEMHAQRARKDMEALQGEAHKMISLFAEWDNRLTAADLRELNGLLKKDARLSDDLQIKTWAIAEVLAIKQLHVSGLSRLAAYPGELINTLAFRYGAMTMGLYLRMRNQPGTYPKNDRDVLAHLIDVKIAAQGTYFDDFLTNDATLKQAYEVAMSLIQVLGGFTRCGRA